MAADPATATSGGGAALPPPPRHASRSPGRWSTRIGNALTVLVTLALFGGLTLMWIERAVFDEQQFANRATRLLDSSEVRNALATEIVDEVIQNGASQLVPYRSVVISVADQVTATPAFKAIFREAVVQAHRAVFTEDGNSVAVNLTGALGILTSSLQISNPDIANKVPADVGQIVVDATSQVRELQLWQTAQDLSSLGESMLVFAAVGGLGTIFLSPTRRSGALRVGVALLTAGLGVIAVSIAIPRVVAGRIADPSLSRAVDISLQDFVGDLRSLGIWSVALGVIATALASAAVPTHEALDARRVLERTRALLAGWQPETDAGRALRAITVIAAGLALVVWRDAVVPVGVAVVGAYVGYVGVLELLHVVGRPPAEVREALAAEQTVSQDHVDRWRRQRIVWLTAVGVSLAVFVGVFGWVNVRASERTALAASRTTCNGSEALCDKRLDQVALPASHNSMSAAASPGWVFAQNRFGIAAQLEYGIRGFLVKTHYGTPSGINLTGADLVVTDRAAEVAVNPKVADEELPPGAVQRAQQLAANAKPNPAARDVYLCHVYCELGAELFTDALKEMKSFLDRNPEEVIVLFIGDYVSHDDTQKRFEEVGLLDRLWEYDQSQPPPTLRQMIEARRNIFMLAEHSGTPPAWNNPGYGLFQDTPFTFTSPSDFEGAKLADSCKPNRGTADSPLFQINHWITNSEPPSLSTAKQVNAFDVLMPRVKACMEERGRFPTLVGVNFYDQGDLLRVVDELNGVDPPGVR